MVFKSNKILFLIDSEDSVCIYTCRHIFIFVRDGSVFLLYSKMRYCWKCNQGFGYLRGIGKSN